MDAVASTIANRKESNLSYLNKDRDLEKICDPKTYQGVPHYKEPTNKMDKEAYDYSKDLATKIYEGKMESTVGKATHFDRDRDSFKNLEKPGKFEHRGKVGAHEFFEEIDNKSKK